MAKYKKDPESDFERADRLASMMQHVGFAIWQLQELETTVAAFLVIRVQGARGIGMQRGKELLEAAERRTLGSLLSDLTKAGIFEKKLCDDLKELLERRNWLVHRARRERRGILHDYGAFRAFLAELEQVAASASDYHKSLAMDIEGYVLKSGVDRAAIESEADRLAKCWGLLD